jgi:phosphinothricin acetyltransferase
MIRAAIPADLAAITAIYNDAVRSGTASFELAPPGLEEMTRRFEALARDGFPYLVADTGGEIAGYAYAGPYRPRAAYRFTVENSVYVAPGWQGKGVGRALLHALIAAAEAQGFRQMVAVIGDSRNTASIALHTAAGFEMTGTLRAVGRKHETWLDTVIMQKELGIGGKSEPPFEPSS